jgi:hypothetical protein
VGSRSAASRTLLAAAVPVGLVLSAALVWQSTAAAFTASTDNLGNQWQAGSVVLADNDGAAALFDSSRDSALKPGSTRPRCIRVDYTGSLPADIKLYVTTPGPTTTLDPYLVVSIERGQDVTPATTVAPDCTGFTPTPGTATFAWNGAPANDVTADASRTLGALKTAARDWTSGLPVASSVAQGTSLTFRITYSVVDSNSAQNAATTANFTWEARNT